jgi:hypothetical protein
LKSAGLLLASGGRRIVMSTKFESEWTIGDRVHIDDDRSIKATVIGFVIGSTGHRAAVEWFHNGEVKGGEFQSYRLTKVDR